MNLVFNIARTYEHEFTSNNLIKSNMVIDRISMKGESPGICLVLDRVNNMQERRQSPLAVLNQAYTENAHMNVVVPKSRKWCFSLTDKTGATIALSMPITVCIHFHTVGGNCVAPGGDYVSPYINES